MIRRNFRIYSNLLEMLRDRGFVVDENLLEFGNFKNYIKEKIDEIDEEDEEDVEWKAMSDKFTNQEGTKNLYVRFIDSKNSSTIGNEEINILMNEIDEIYNENYETSKKEKEKKEKDKDFEVIIVVSKMITNPAMTNLMNKKVIRFTIFRDKELLINPTKHILVPKHRLMNAVEKSELFNSYRVKPNQLPRIFSSDPIAKYYGAWEGDIFKIIQTDWFDDSFVRETLNYRYVIKEPEKKK